MLIYFNELLHTKEVIANMAKKKIVKKKAGKKKKR